MEKKIFLVVTLGLILITGCAPPSKTLVDSVEMSQEPNFRIYPPSKTEEGSLWSESGGLSLYLDRRARKVGDIVTVRIVEDPEAELNANTKTSRTSSMEAKLEFLGFMKALAEKNPRLAQRPGEDPLIKSDLSSSFDGKGGSNRDGHIKAYVSAVVTHVLPNGNLYINGKREIKVNHETQYITLVGMIRPEDIGPTNEIASTYVADARIGYSGNGPVADKQKPGWLGRIVEHVWPF